MKKINEYTIHQIPALKDNYIFIIELPEKKSIVIDPSTSTDVIDFCKSHNLTVETILLTHHHPDHIGGAIELKHIYNSSIYGPELHFLDIPFLDHKIKNQNQILKINNLEIDVFNFPGHTKGHLAFLIDENLFSGDVLFGLGSGRIFDGTLEEMFDTINMIKELDKKIKIYCSHEYTLLNLQFIEKYFSEYDHYKNDDFLHFKKSLFEKIKFNNSTVPLDLENELKWNPFLLCDNFEQYKDLRSLRNKG